MQHALVHAHTTNDARHLRGIHAAVFLFLLRKDCQHQLHVGSQFGVEGTFQKEAESGQRSNKRKRLATTTPYRQVYKKKLNLGRELE